MQTTLLYALFAVIAIAVNITSQDVAVRVYGGPFSLYISIAAGTLTGLVVKYLLDKRYIFAYQTRGMVHEGAKFFLYTCMGLVTTMIFWGTELSFEFLFHTRAMRYTGGLIGLVVGYIIKYRLDRHFVFVDGSASRFRRIFDKAS